MRRMGIKKALFLPVIAVILAGAAGCAEAPQSTVDGQAEYTEEGTENRSDMEGVHSDFADADGAGAGSGESADAEAEGLAGREDTDAEAEDLAGSGESTGADADDLAGSAGTDAEAEDLAGRAGTDAEIFASLDGRIGDFGRLVFADGSYSAALYYEVEDDPAQVIVDAEDSAVATRRKEYPDSTLVIADHTNQGFSVLYDAKPKETEAYLFRSEEVVEVYQCTDKFIGHNNLKYLTDEDGNDLSFAPTDLVMYTCNESWKNVTITYWKRVKTIENPAPVSTGSIAL